MMLAGDPGAVREAEALGEAALAGDHEAMQKAVEIICAQLGSRMEARLIPPSLQEIYDQISAGTGRCVQFCLFRSKLFNPKRDMVALRIEITQEATAAWFLCDPKRLPRWSPADGCSLAAFARVHAERHVIEAINQRVRRGA